jgi:hypothetical protein
MRGHRRITSGAVSALIISTLGFQLAIGFGDLGSYAWPLISYDMYATPRFDGDRIEHYTVAAVLADETRVPVGRRDVGLNVFEYRNHVVGPVRRGDVEALAPVIAAFCNGTGGSLVRLEVLDSGVAISRTGPVLGLEPALVAGIDVGCEGGPGGGTGS